MSSRFGLGTIAEHHREQFKGMIRRVNTESWLILLEVLLRA
jgi:hypothetical protein